MQTTALPPVRKSIEVAAAPDRAFRIFTTDMQRWWPRCGEQGADREDVVLEPHTGGRWFARKTGGIESHWGQVIAWDPPVRLLLAWQIDMENKFDPTLFTEVEISFEAVPVGRTRVTVEHRHLERFGVRAEEARQMYDSPHAWVGVLEALRDALPAE